MSLEDRGIIIVLFVLVLILVGLAHWRISGLVRSLQQRPTPSDRYTNLAERHEKHRAEVQRAIQVSGHSPRTVPSWPAKED